MSRRHTPEEAVATFWSHVNRDGPQPDVSVYGDIGCCWAWTGATTSGYGSLRFERRTEYAHRRSWVLANGPIPDGQRVLHRCDNALCVRPSHLFLGTQADNMLDMASKRRSHRPAGERNPRARLTFAIVEECRIRHAAGETGVALAAEFGVSNNAMHAALRGEAWTNRHCK